ncbi:hypothetical protein D3C85_1183630 [compost metagenome]
MARCAQQAEVAQPAADRRGLCNGNIGQQQALPGCQPQAGIAHARRQPGGATQLSGRQTAQGWRCTDGDPCGLALWISAQEQVSGCCLATPTQNNRVTPHRQRQLLDKGLGVAFLEQLTHARLIGPGQVEKAFEHGHYQCMALGQRHGAQRRRTQRAPRQAEGQPDLSLQQ